MRFKIITLILTVAGIANAEDLYSAIAPSDTNALAAATHSDSVNTIDKWGWTPLIHAASAGNYEACVILLGKGADISKKDKMGFSALDYVNMRLQSVSERESTSEYLKNQGIRLPDVTATNRAAVDTNGLFRVKQLLENTGTQGRTNPGDVQDIHGGITNHAARWAGDQKSMERLFESGFDVNSSKGDGITPLMHAAAEGNYELCKFLVDHGAKIDVVDNKGQSVRDYVCKKKGDQSTAAMINVLLGVSQK